MSGSGGFYKYRCKYFLTHNCPNWVFVNHAPCAECCAAGRDANDNRPDDRLSRRVAMMPGLENGTLRYTLAEVAVNARLDADSVAWTCPMRPSTLSQCLSQGSRKRPAPLPHLQLWLQLQDRHQDQHQDRQLQDPLQDLQDLQDRHDLDGLPRHELPLPPPHGRRQQPS